MMELCEPLIKYESGLAEMMSDSWKIGNSWYGCERLLNIIEFLPDATFVVDNEKNVVVWNRAMEEMTGVNQNEVVGNSSPPYAEALYHARRPMLVDLLYNHSSDSKALYDSFWREGNTVYAESFVPTAYRGRGAFLWGKASPLYNSGGAIIGAIETIRDITKRKLDEEQLRVKDVAITSSINGICFADLEGTITEVNPSLLKMWGYTEKQAVLGKISRKLWRDRERVKQAIRELYRKGGWFGELTAVRKDGNFFTVQVSASLVKDGGDNPVGIMSSFIDVSDYKRARQELNRREEIYRTLVESSLDLIFKVNAQGIYTFVNSRFTSILGYSVDELVGNHFTDIIDPAQAQIARQHFEDGMKGKTVPTYEIDFIHKTGRSIPVELSVTTVVNSEGESTARLGVGRDITERRQSMKKITESEEKYRSLVENIQDVVFSIDKNGIVTYVSPAVKTISDLSPSEITGTHISTFVYREDLIRLSEMFSTFTSENDKVIGEECRLFTKSGQMRWVRISGNPVFKENRLAGIHGILSDITKIKKKEWALQESEERYRTLTENVADGVCVVKDRRIVFANMSFMSMFDFEGSDCAIGIKALDVMHDDDKQNLSELIKELEEHRSTKKIFHGRCRARSGREFWVEGHNICIKWDGQPAILSTIRDITERKLREDAVREESDRLEKENRRLRSFIKGRYRLGPIIGKSAPMQEIYELIYKASASHANVIIYGESGTGKEVVARTIHDMSDRSGYDFVAVNCGAIPENLLESEFFGHRRGAFTGAVMDKHGYLDLAKSGTLFLDEVGELGLNMQVKLLRAIDGGGYTPLGSGQMKKADCRMIAATNRDLKEFVQKGLMREDFFYRIHIIPITLPPLRDRREDIPLLIQHFLKDHCLGNGSSIIPDDVMEALVRYDWPGNVRELQNVLHRYLTIKKLDFMYPEHIAYDHESDENNAIIQSHGETLDAAMANFEKKYIIGTLEEHRWHRGKACTMLGISRNTLFRKMRYHGMI